MADRREATKNQKDGACSESQDTPSGKTPKTGSKRGRPRVEVRDASAVERRRTQIRVAQRAYRARKDSTISDLQTQVSTLQSVVQDATSDLQGVSKRLANIHGLASASIQVDLRAAINKLLDLSISFEAATSSSSIEKSESTPDYSQPQIRSQSGSESTVNLEKDSDEAGLFGGDSDADGTEPFTLEPLDVVDGSSMDWVDPFAKSSNNASELSTFTIPLYGSLPRMINPAPTFSWQETSFARRLMRASHELCLRHLENPSDKYGSIIAKSRFSLAFVSTDAFLMKLRKSVAKSTTDELEDWSMPMLHVGGAGLHFGRKEQESGELLDTSVSNLGPFPMPTASIPVPPSVYPNDVARWLGLEGIWLDHKDVETYLKRKGLNLEGAASTAIYEIQNGTDRHESASWQDSRRRNISLDFMPFPESGKYDTNMSGTPELISASFAKTLRTKKVVLSIDELIEKLNANAICLGRAPGYKREDIDDAFDKVLETAQECITV